MEDLKYERLRQYFWENFIDVDPDNEKGSNIPCEALYARGSKFMGDGTINLSLLMNYLYLRHLNGEQDPINLGNCLATLQRLSAGARKVYASLLYKSDPCEEGFFLRDDCVQPNVEWGALQMLESLEYEEDDASRVDPCFSPFTSQDQVWNLNPILATIMEDETLQPEYRNHACQFGFAINDYIKKNNYTIYNPYLSLIVHRTKTLPPSKLSLTQRRLYVEKKPVKKIKVKRGANNWYYSGGTLACQGKFAHIKYDRARVRTLLYKGIVFFLDRIYEPILQKTIHADFKHHSYHCYAACSGIWYNDGFKDRFRKKFQESLKRFALNGKLEEIFELSLAPIVLKDEALTSADRDNLMFGFNKFNYNYSGYRKSPLEAMIVYEFRKRLIYNQNGKE